MDHPQYSTLLEALSAVPDPRRARGKQLEWTFILAVIASALVSQQRSVAAMAQWATSHATTLVSTFQPARGRVPSEATLRRALRHVEIARLEHCLTHLTLSAPSSTSATDQPHFQGYAVDGKHVRGAGTHGAPTLLVSLVQHHSRRVLAQTRVAQKRHESHGVEQLLAGQDLTGMVITLDAGLTYPALAAQILDQGGHYLMVVKRNQAQLYEELTWYFDTPPLPCDRAWHASESVTKAHGRLETRSLTCTDDLDGYLRWPGVRQVLRRQCERTLLKSGKMSHAVTYALTSLTPLEATAPYLAALWRGHWIIENAVHYVRDVTMGEDAHQMHTGNAPQAVAALRNAWLNVLRAVGWTNMAAALRHYSWSLTDALQILGVTPLRL